jgi:hypothetical protein
MGQMEDASSPGGVDASSTSLTRRRLGLWRGRVEVSEGTDLVASDSDVLAMFDDEATPS